MDACGFGVCCVQAFPLLALAAPRRLRLRRHDSQHLLVCLLSGHQCTLIILCYVSYGGTVADELSLARARARSLSLSPLCCTLTDLRHATARVGQS